MLTPMRFSLKWVFAVMGYIAITMTAIWQRNAFCAAVLLAATAVTFLYSLFLSFATRGESYAKAIRWVALGSLSLFGVCLALWFASTFSELADFELSFGMSQLRVADGSVVICDHLGNLEVIELVDKSLPMSPSPQGKYGFSIPGMSFRYITFVGSNQPVWLWKASLLFPAGAAILIASFFIMKASRCRILNSGDAK